MLASVPTVVFLFLGAACAAIAASGRGPWWAFAWPAACFAVVAAGYAGLGPRILGKRADGQRAFAARVLMAPYLLLALATWNIIRFLRRGRPPTRALFDDVVIGRRLTRDEPAPFASVLDLSAELDEPAHCRALPGYRCHPWLDGTAPSGAEIVRVVDEIEALPRPLFIHCAEGYGRAAVVACALVAARSLASDVDGAVAYVRARRRGIWLRRPQRKSVADAIALLVARRRA